MKKLIIHIGYPKTATSTLQANLFSLLKQEGKIEYLSHDKSVNTTISINKILSYILGRKESKDFTDEIQNLKEIRNKITIFSNESLSHVSSSSPKAANKIGAYENAYKLKEIFNHLFDHIEIIMTIRAQESIIPSYYTQEYFNILNEKPKINTISKWLFENLKDEISSNDLIFNYDKMYKTYTEHFGNENVHVLLFEDLLYDKPTYYKKLAKIIGIDQNIVKSAFETNIRNVTKKKSGNLNTDSGSLGNILSYTYANLFGDYKNNNLLKFTKRILKKIIPSKLLKKQLKNYHFNVNNLKIEEIDLIHNRYDASNENLSSQLGLNKDKLKKYKYFI